MTHLIFFAAIVVALSVDFCYLYRYFRTHGHSWLFGDELEPLEAATAVAVVHMFAMLACIIALSLWQATS